MKRKKGLYREFIGALLLALILTGVISFVVSKLANFVGLTDRHVSPEKLIEDMDEQYFDSIDDYFEGIDMEDETQVQDAFSEMIAKYKSDVYIITALVTESGELVLSNEIVVIIEQKSDMNNVIFSAVDDKSNMVFPLTFDKSRMYLVYNTDALNLSLQRTIKLGDYYLITYINRYSDYDTYNLVETISFILQIIVYFIILFIIVNTRIKYLVLLGDSISKVGSKKELLNVPIKQKNEITYIASALNQMSETIIMADEKEKAMILSLSHDLRTPLNSIIGYVQLVEEGKYDNEVELNSYLQHIKLKTMYLQVMVEDFFDMIRLSSGEYKINQKDINLIELLRQTVGEYMPISLDKQIDFDISIKNGMEKWTKCSCDPTLVRRLFNNLFDNVLKYTEKGSTCEVGLNEVGQIYIFNKSKKRFDDGDLTYLFGKYTRGDDSRTGEGYGLGLYIVGQIAELHQWDIRCISEDGVFKVYISRKELY